MTDEAHEKAAQRYRAAMQGSHEVVTDGEPESPSEHAGISRIRHISFVVVALVIGLVAGATVFAAMNWRNTRPNPNVRIINEQQSLAVLAAAKKETAGFNDGAVGALYANGYRPVGLSIDRNTKLFYVILDKCQAGSAPCLSRLATSPNPVVYLGVSSELSEAPTEIHFIPSQVQVDFALDNDRVQRCGIYRGKAKMSEPWPVMFNLPGTIEKLKTRAGDQPVIDMSPDNGDTYWECAPVKVG